MLELILSPRKAERNPWEMIIIGLFYGTLAILLVSWIFGQDPVLAKYSGILIVTFTVMFTLPFMYHLIKNEEEKDIEYIGFFRILKEHNRALLALLFLFVGLVIAYSFWYLILPSNYNFNAQIEMFCQINQPGNINGCVSQFQPISEAGKITGNIASTDKILSIFSNNVYVLIFTLIFSLIFGAGAIFVLAWNASVIAAAIGIFAKSSLSNLPLGVARYLIHGIPEIAAYFVGALAGGIVGIAIIKHDSKTEKFWSVLQDALNLVIIAVIILLIAAMMEVFVTPMIFGG